MNSRVRPWRSRASSMTAITSAWVVTSRAVVGSSASSSRGSAASAAAIMTRCSRPPESSAGRWRRRRAASATWTSSSSAVARASAAARVRPRTAVSASVRKSPTVRSGLMWARGSWKTMAAPPRRRARSSGGRMAGTEAPSKRTSPVRAAPGGSRPRTLRAVSDLPEPDSPTSPTALPGASARSTRCRTVRRVPCGPGRVTRRASNSSRGVVMWGLRRGAGTGRCRAVRRRR